MVRTSRNGTRVVYLLMSYSQEEYIAAAVASACAQDFPSLEIVISDDCSPDRTFAVIEEQVAAYRGPHRIRLNHNPQRLGSVNHLVFIAETIGDAFIVTAHGDDVSLAGRTRRLVDVWRSQRVSMVSSGAEWIDSDGSKDDDTRRTRRISAEEILHRKWIPEMLGATLAFDSRVLSAFPKLDRNSLACGLDHVLPLRAALLDGLYYVSDKLIGYRRHPGNMSRVMIDRGSGQDVYDEGYAAFELALRSAQRRDILAAPRKHWFDRKHWRLLANFDRDILAEVEGWAMCRARLTNQDLVATWVPKREIRAQASDIEVSF